MRSSTGTKIDYILLHSDKLVLAALFLVYLVLGAQRLDFAGDGVRHLPHILQSTYPVLGEPRWLLFPSLLFVVVKPFVIAGVVHTAPESAKVFCFFNVACGLLYLLCLRRWLLERRPQYRAAVLLLAGSSYVFLTLATDTIEPTPAVLIAVAGLTFARFRNGLDDRTRLTIAVATIVLASLIYQGLLISFFFLPVIFPISLLVSLSNALRIASLALLVPLITVVLLTFAGDSPKSIIRQFIEGAPNTASSRQYMKRTVKNLVGVGIIGPTYAFANIPELRGVIGSISLLRSQETLIEGAWGIIAWCCMAAAIVSAIMLLIFKSEFWILFSYAGLLLLPAIKMSQYSYMKFYVLLPFLMALAIPRIGANLAYPMLLGILLLLSNVGQIQAEITEAAALRLRVARELYPQLPQAPCFLTAGWGVPVPNWPGDSVAWAHILNAGSSTSQTENASSNSRLLSYRLKELFCKCPIVLTDNFVQPNLASLQQELSYFQMTGVPLAKLVISSPEPVAVFKSPKFVVYRFSSEEQRQACERLE